MTYKNRAEVYPLIVPGKRVVEIGVFAGDNARDILACKPAHLTLVDTWQGECESGDENGRRRRRVDLAAQLNILSREFDGEPVTFISGRSPDCLSIIPGVVDVVYIDGDHSYRGVKADLEAAYQLVDKRRGAYICGHDYSKRTPGVIRAVDDFCESIGRPIKYLTTNRLPSYFIEC